MMRTNGSPRQGFDKLSDICPMSRAPSDDLHALITVLTQAERRYVKVELRKHVLGDVNQSELLFDALAGQTVYNADAIKKRFKGQGFAKRLPEAKRELLKVVLRAMRQFHAEKTPSRKALSAITDAYFVLRRGRTDLAKRLLNDAINQSSLIHNDALHALALSAMVDARRNDDEQTEPSSSPADDRFVRAARALQESAYVEGLLDRMQTLVTRYGRSPDAAAKALAADIIEEGERLQPFTSMSAQSTWLRILSIKALFIDGSPQKSLDYDRSRLDVIERDERYRKANIHHWVNLTHSVALRLVVVGQHESAKPYRDKLRSYYSTEGRSISPTNRRAAEGHYLNIELLLAVQDPTTDIKQQLPLLRMMLADHEEDNLTELGLACHFNIGLHEFSHKRFRDAIRQLGNIDDYPPTMRKDIRDASTYLRLLCHLELEHESMVNSIIRKQRRSLKGATIPADEELLMSFATKYLDLPLGKKREQALQRLLGELNILAKENADQMVTEVFGMRGWVERKFEG